MSIVGDWHIDYVETNTKTTITFYPNGTFFQQAGRYVGTWFQNNLNLTLKFDTLTLPNEVGPITLDAKINYDFKFFSGTKPNKSYAGGLLHYNASFLNLQPSTMPTDVHVLPGPVTKTTSVQNVQSNLIVQNSQQTSVPSSEDDNDSPCQVRRTRY